MQVNWITLLSFYFVFIINNLNLIFTSFNIQLEVFIININYYVFKYLSCHNITLKWLIFLQMISISVSALKMSCLYWFNINSNYYINFSKSWLKIMKLFENQQTSIIITMISASIYQNCSLKYLKWVLKNIWMITKCKSFIIYYYN